MIDPLEFHRSPESVYNRNWTIMNQDELDYYSWLRRKERYEFLKSRYGRRDRVQASEDHNRVYQSRWIKTLAFQGFWP